MAELRPDLDEYVAHLDGVKNRVRGQTERIAGRARANLARHRAEGDARITTSYGKTDGFANLDDTGGDRAAAAIERGGVRRSGQPFPGLYILGRAAR